MNRIKYIDGFRGIAVISVLLFHLNLFTAGFAGVELFFVISGYIITYLLFNEWERTGSIGIKDFYRRRITRIYPPLLLLLVLVFLFFLNYPITSIKEKFISESLFSSVGLTNWFEIIHNDGYWENGVQSPLLHLWSISIEIQFYLFWPFLMKLIFTGKETLQQVKKWFFPLIGLCILLFASLTIFRSFHDSFNILYYSTFTRMISFIIGGFFAGLTYSTTLSPAWKKWSTLFTPVTLLALIFLTFQFHLNDIQLFRGMLLLYASLFGCLLYQLGLCEPTHWYRKIIENRLFLFFGTISYSLYLWHVPVFIFLTKKTIPTLFHLPFEITSLMTLGIQLLVAILLGSLSYLFIECGIRLKTLRGSLILAIALPLIIGVLTIPAVSERLIFVDHQPALPENWAGNEPIITEGKEPLLVVGDSWSRRVAFGIFQVEKDAGNQQHKVLLYGVNNGSIMSPDYFVHVADGNQLPPYKSSLEAYLDYWDTAIKQYHPKKVILVFGKADQALMVINGKQTLIDQPGFEEKYIAQYQKVIDFFVTRGITIYMTNVPNNTHSAETSDYSNRSVIMNGYLDTIVKNNQSKVTLLDIHTLLANGTSYSPEKIGSVFMYDETDHTSYNGSKYMSQWILNQM